MRRSGYFHPVSVFWRVLREQALVAGGGAALLLQVAHPAIARGVSEHSNFRERPLDRLYNTLATVRAIVFGSRAQADSARTRLRSMHARVQGSLADGRPYSARDPQAAYWVHATLMHTAIATHEALLAPLTRAELEAFHADASRLALLFDLPPDVVPATWQDFEHDFQTRCATLQVGDEARDIAALVLDPPLRWVPAFARRDLRTATAALLPSEVALAYGLPAQHADSAEWLRLQRRLRAARRRLPLRLATAPASWRR